MPILNNFQLAFTLINNSFLTILSKVLETFFILLKFPADITVKPIFEDKRSMLRSFSEAISYQP